MRRQRLTARDNLPWNREKIIGQKPPLKLREVWSIRVRLQIAGRLRDLALFNLAIASFAAAISSPCGHETWHQAER